MKIPEPNLFYGLIVSFATMGVCWFVHHIVWPVAQKIVLALRDWSNQ